MKISIIRNDQGILFAQLGVRVNDAEELQQLCESEGETFVDFINIKSGTPQGAESLAVLERLCILNSEGLGNTIEEMLAQAYQAGLTNRTA